MLVLGKTNDDKGTQLEKLTMRLLSARQYRNICKSWIGPGGEEIDVRAEYLVPGLKDNKTYKVICECKAYKSAVGITDWLKFCGKLYVEQQTQSKDTQGCFIALSDVNGNVRGNYDELKKHDANVELITGDDLLDLVRQVYSLSDLKSILDHLNTVTDRVCRRSEVAYYEEQVYWLLLFEHEAYTVLKADGKPLSGEEVANLGQTIESTLPVKQYVNLQEEAQARQRALDAEARLVAYLMENGGCATLATLIQRNKESTPQETEAAAENLLSQRIIDGDIRGELQLPADDYQRVAELYRLLFRRACPLAVLGCAWYDDHINPHLLAELKQVQRGLPLCDEDTDTIINLLRLSPLALRCALHPIDVIVEHRTNYQATILTPEIDRADRSYFLKVLCDSLQRDFTLPALSHYYYHVRGMRELELTGAYVLKSQTNIALRQEYKQRQILGVFAGPPEQVIRMLALENVPEPWQSPQPPSEPPAAPPKDSR